MKILLYATVFSLHAVSFLSGINECSGKSIEKGAENLSSLPIYQNKENVSSEGLNSQEDSAFTIRDSYQENYTTSWTERAQYFDRGASGNRYLIGSLALAGAGLSVGFLASVTPIALGVMCGLLTAQIVVGRKGDSERSQENKEWRHPLASKRSRLITFKEPCAYPFRC